MKVIILRGIPGSGKSHFAEERYPTADVVSADHLFERRAAMLGEAYSKVFKTADLPLAHGQCLREFLRLTVGDPNEAPISEEDMEDFNSRVVVVDNTNISPVEIAPYIALAQAYKHEVEILRVQCDPKEAFARNTHGVPEHIVDRMYRQLQTEELPPWWPEETFH